jgi:hypothetical protein
VNSSDHTLPLPTRESTDRLFWLVLAVTTGLKLVMSGLVPLTGDEAYFAVWGRHLDYGYYDHGAMTGWWLWPALAAGNSVLLLRLPATLTILAGGLLLRGILRSVDPIKANFAGMFFLLSPVNFLHFVITTDTPLLLFAMLAGGFAIRAVRRDRLVDWLLAGLCLGFGFLAKYFAVVMGLSFAIYLLCCGGRRRFTGILAVLLGAIPGVAINVAWNVNHGWTNVLFNVYTRNADVGFSPLTFVVYVLPTSLALAGPVVLYFLFRPQCEGRRTWREAWAELQASGTHLAFFIVAVPALLFLGVSIARLVGLHWLISFHAFFFLLLVAKFDLAALRRQVRPTVLCMVGLTALGLVILALPVEWLKSHRSYSSIVLGTHPDEVLAQLAPYTADYVITTPSYTKSAQLGFRLGRNVPVIGAGSFHGREDDFITDFRTLDGRDVLVFAPQADDLARLSAFLGRTEAREITVRGARIPILLGRSFNYPAYRDAVLRPVAERYYRMPAWLAPLSRPSPFLTRYGLEAAATAGGPAGH